MPTAILDVDRLATEAARRGMSLTSLCEAAGISSPTQAKISKRIPVRISIAGRLEKALQEIPLMTMVGIELEELAG